MRVKNAVYPFIPAVIVMLFFKLMSLFGLDGNGTFMGMNPMNITYVVIGICVGLFVVSVIINIFDRKTAPVYPVKKNVAAGVMALLSGALVIAGSAAKLSSAITGEAESEYLMMIIICAVFSLPAGIALMLMSKVHFQGKSIVSSVSILFVFPSLWGCAELVTEFLMATKASIYSRDLSSMFCYIFLTLYLFSNSMIVSRIKGRNPVKSCFIYGLPGVAISVTYGVYELLRLSKEGYDYASLLTALQFLALGLYAASFITEMFFNSYTKDEFEIVDALPVDDKEVMRITAKKNPSDDDLKIVEQAQTEQDYIDTKEYDELVFSDNNPEENPHVIPDDDFYDNNKGMDDFVIGYRVDEEDDEPIPYFTKHEQQNTDTPIMIPYEEDNAEKLTIQQPVQKKPQRSSAAEALRKLEEAKAAGAKSQMPDIVVAAPQTETANSDAPSQSQQNVDEDFVHVTSNNNPLLEDDSYYQSKSQMKADSEFIHSSEDAETQKDDDYYERRMEEINNLLMGMEE